MTAEYGAPPATTEPAVAEALRAAVASVPGAVLLHSVSVPRGEAVLPHLIAYGDLLIPVEVRPARAGALYAVSAAGGFSNYVLQESDADGNSSVLTTTVAARAGELRDAFPDALVTGIILLAEIGAEVGAVPDGSAVAVATPASLAPTLRAVVEELHPHPLHPPSRRVLAEYRAMTSGTLRARPDADDMEDADPTVRGGAVRRDPRERARRERLRGRPSVLAVVCLLFALVALGLALFNPLHSPPMSASVIMLAVGTVMLAVTAERRAARYAMTFHWAAMAAILIAAAAPFAPLLRFLLLAGL